jgi:tetratricopeptide (TPR) repeat protein
MSEPLVIFNYHSSRFAGTFACIWHQISKDMKIGDSCMKKLLVFLIFVVVSITAVSAQKLPRPKKFPAEATPTQQKMIQEGIQFHDAKKYDEAIAKYEAVLNQNPDSTMAMYEIALSYYNRGDKAKAKEVAYRGANYISDDLALFYGLIANCLDDEGKPEDAVKIYVDAADILKGYPDMKRHLASIYYNLGITYFGQKKYTESRAAAKNAVENNFSYPSPHYLLSVIYGGTKYKIPAFLSAARFISLEYNTDRTDAAVKTLTSILKPAEKDPKTGNINIFMDLNAPKDEGDFGMFDLLLGTLVTVRGDEDKNKSDNQMFIEGIGSVIALLDEDKKMGSTFVGKTYVPFMVEMKKKGHLDTFGNMVLYLNDKNNPDASKWVKANGPKLQEFIAWAKAYQLSSK